MTKNAILLLFSLISLNCNLINDNSKSILFKGEIDEGILNRLMELDLITKNDTVLGLSYSISTEHNSEAEDYTFFTKNKLVRYFHFGDDRDEATIYEVSFDKALSIIRKPYSIDSSILYFKVEMLDTVLFNKYEQRDDIFSKDFEFIILRNNEVERQEKFYNLLVDEWKKNKQLKKLKETNDKFFDEEGDRKITADNLFEREKIRSIKDELDKLSIKVIDEIDYLVLNYNNSIILIDYYFYSKKYTFLKLVVDPLPTDDYDIIAIAAMYPRQHHDSIVFPFSERGITYKEGYLSYENNEKDIIEKYFK